MNNINLDRPLTNFDLKKLSKIMKISLRGIYMLDNLPSKNLPSEMAIVNLDKTSGSGTHWVAYHKIDKNVFYFDPIGNLQPPRKLVSYWNKERHMNIYYNIDQVQPHNSIICGHLCLLFLCNQL